MFHGRRRGVFFLFMLLFVFFSLEFTFAKNSFQLDEELQQIQIDEQISIDTVAKSWKNMPIDDARVESGDIVHIDTAINDEIDSETNIGIDSNNQTYTSSDINSEVDSNFNSDSNGDIGTTDYDKKIDNDANVEFDVYFDSDSIDEVTDVYPVKDANKNVRNEVNADIDPNPDNDVGVLHELGMIDVNPLQKLQDAKAARQMRIVHGGHTHTMEEIEENAGWTNLLFLAVAVISQIFVFYFNHKYPIAYSYIVTASTLFSPMIWLIYVKADTYRFYACWIMFASYTGYLVYLSRQRVLAPQTPRRVHGFFTNIFHVCWFAVVISLLLIISDIFGVTFFLDETLFYGHGWIFPITPIALQLLWFGLYFGLLGRDIAILLANHLASRSRMAVQKNMHAAINCGVCRQPFDQASITQTLSCRHKFHSACLHGYFLIGKKSLCPLCNEKVNVNDFFPVWQQKGSFLWGTFLDAFRYVLSVNPFVMLLANFVLLLVF